MASLGNTEKGCLIIRVPSPIPEPTSFDAECRQPGLAWIAANPNPKGRPTDYWSDFRNDLRIGFSRRCGYFAMYIHDGTIDHFMSWNACKLANPELAYEWTNFRFICNSLNSKKHTNDSLLDPFEVQDNWFEMLIPSFVLRLTNHVPIDRLQRARNTMDDLDLQQGRRAIRLRWEWYEEHRNGRINMVALMNFAPLVGRAITKWVQDGNGPLPAIPCPDRGEN